MSKLHGQARLFNDMACCMFVLHCIVWRDSRNSRISGARYSGVVDVICVTLWNSNAEPKSINLIYLMSV